MFCASSLPSATTLSMKAGGALTRGHCHTRPNIIRQAADQADSDLLESLGVVKGEAIGLCREADSLDLPGDEAVLAPSASKTKYICWMSKGCCSREAGWTRAFVSGFPKAVEPTEPARNPIATCLCWGVQTSTAVDHLTPVIVCRLESLTALTEPRTCPANLLT